MTLEETLTTILDVVAFKSDDNGSNISILGKAKEDLSIFLTDHTSISDDEKAKRISDFFTNTIISVTTQAIQVAGEAPLQAVQMQTMQDETAQKIASMKIDDTIKQEQSAKDLDVKSSNILVDNQKIASMQSEDTVREAQSAKDLDVKSSNILVDNQKIASMQSEDTVREAQSAKDLDVKTSQIATETQKVASMQLQDTNATNESVQKVISMQNDDKAKLNNSAVNVAKAKAEIETLIPAQVQQITKDIELKSKQIDTEVKRLDIMDKDILIKQQQIELEAVKIPLYQAQTDNERAKVGLTAQQVRVSATEVQYKLAQIKAIQKAGELNKEIEDNKNKTNITIARIYKS